MAGLLVQLIRTSGRPIRDRVFSISMAITRISRPNSASHFWPSAEACYHDQRAQVRFGLPVMAIGKMAIGKNGDRQK
jgi:hypothetical protein